MTDSLWPADFDPTDPDLLDAVCRMCEEPASYAIILRGAAEQSIGSMVMLCKVCEHYLSGQHLDALVARSPDASAETDLLAEAIIRDSVQVVPFQLGAETPDTWD